MFGASEIKWLGYLFLFCAVALILWGGVIESSPGLVAMGVLVMSFGVAAVRYSRDVEREDFADLWGSPDSE